LKLKLNSNFEIEPSLIIAPARGKMQTADLQIWPAEWQMVGVSVRVYAQD